MAGNGELKLKGQSADEIRLEIERARQQIQISVVALREEVAVATDWRVWYRRRPYACLAAAFALGVFLGTRGRAD